MPMESMSNTARARRVGVSSIIDLSGDASDFEALSRREPHEGDWEAVGGDVDRVRRDLLKAVLRAYHGLSQEEKRHFIAKLRTGQ